uniref:Signal-induced proliferation-associated 1-like protein 1 n=1 Tax=Stegastes partitus TaxID=144197 RepID=A0A3B5AH70_9TELE
NKDHGQQYNYRVIFRTSELNTLRGSILEDAVPSTSKHGLGRGLPLKEVLEYLVPELNVHCLRLALNTPKVTEQLMKLDEQGLSFQRKVGVMYCMAGQSSEEEMYNNEAAGPALEEFLHLLGERVRLKGFTKYRAQLDTKSFVHTHLIMFHCLCLLRKRHIGNDIVTIVFQEPGALPFTPKNIRSHFQHVFVIVRAHNPCSDNSSYSVAVTRSKDVPSFGPPIPEGVTFPKSSVFRDFLLAKVINAENAAHKSHKFRAMATRTRQEYLRDLAERHTTSTPIDPSGKFPFISLAHKKKEKSRPYGGAELRSLGAVTWPVHAEDHGNGGELEALLSISNDFLILLDQDAKAVVFNCATKDVIGWTLSSPASLRIFYERGENVSLRSISNNTEDFKEVVKRLEFLTKGCETSEMTLRRNGLGQLGFHVNYEGIVAEVEPYGYAWQAGLRQGSRLVEICKVAVATLTHEQMIDLLRTSVTVRVVIIPPHDDATPRRGCSELYRMPVSEYKGSSSDSGSFEYKFPFRSNNNKWQRTSSSPQQSLTASPQPHTPNRAISLGSSVGKTLSAERLERGTAIPRSVSSDGRPLDTKRLEMSPGSESYSLASSLALGRSPHNRSSPSNLSCSSDASGSSAHWRQKSMPEQVYHIKNGYIYFPQVLLKFYTVLKQLLCNLFKNILFPLMFLFMIEKPLGMYGQNYDQVFISFLVNSSDGPYSGHSSSNTLSSTASSGGHSDSDKWYELGAGGGSSGDQGDTEPNGLGGGGYLQGASADSGIDTSSYGASHHAHPHSHHGSTTSLLAPSGGRDSRERSTSPWHSPTEGARRMLERSPAAAESPGPPGERNLEGTGRSPPTHLLVRDSSTFSLSEAGSHSRSVSERTPVACSSCHSSPREESSSSATSPSSQSSASPGPKSFYPRQGAQSKYLIGWRKPGSTINSVDFGDTRDVVPTPAARPSLRDMHSPQSHAKSTMEEDVKRHSAPDSPPPPRKHKEKVLLQSPPGQPLSRRRSLHRTLSDESIYRGQRLPPLSDSVAEPALGADVLFSCSTLPRSPTTRGVPLRRPSYKLGVKLHGDLSASDTSLVDLVERHRGPLPQELMPLPSSGRESLEWTHLVDVANTFENERNTHYGIFCLFISLLHTNTPLYGNDLYFTFVHLMSLSSPEKKVTKLEAMVKMLQEDLKKEREEKLRLQTQIKRLWEDNQRLQEESQTSAAKLKKFTEWVFNTIDMN